MVQTKSGIESSRSEFKGTCNPTAFTVLQYYKYYQLANITNTVLQYYHITNESQVTIVAPIANIGMISFNNNSLTVFYFPMMVRES
jgi:hypothetical protein